MGEILLTVLVIARHTGVVFLLVSHQSLFDRKLFVTNVASKRLVVDVGQYMLSQLISGHKLTRTEDAVNPATDLIFFAGLRGLLDLRGHLGGRLIHIFVLIVGVLMLMLDVGDNVIPRDEILVTKVTLEVTADHTNIVLSVIVNVLVLRVLIISQLHVEVLGGAHDGVPVFPHLMTVTVGLGCEPQRTLPTLEGLLAGVGQDVPLEAGLQGNLRAQ